jgi:hypothetical protein
VSGDNAGVRGHDAATTAWGLLKEPTAFAPLLMSAAALGAVLLHLAVTGSAPQADEGAAAHLWQILMALQVPVVLVFAVRWLPQSPRPAVRILALQGAAVAAAAAPVFLLGW